jgi:hypothetical protein
LLCHEREWINPHEDSTRAGTNVIDVYERLRAAGQVRPLLLVFPSMSSDDNRVPGLLVNMLAPQRAESSGLGSGRSTITSSTICCRMWRRSSLRWRVGAG